MNLEILFKEIIEGDSSEISNQFFDAILDHWLYFYFHEKPGSDTKPGKGNVDVVLFTGKDNPITIPMVENELGCNGVAYTNSDLSLRSAEFECKVGKMRGVNALKMFYGIPSLDGIYIQGDYGHIHLNKEKIAELVGEISK